MGIGNPERRYNFNRHNIGFMLLDYFAQSHSVVFKPSKFNYYSAKGKLSGNSFLLVKPTTYVNNSGLAALHVVQKYETEVKDFLVIADDVNLQFADLRIRKSGGDGGHNGINSIIFHLQTDQFPRLRLGIGSNFVDGEMADYVLADFSEEEKKVLQGTFKTGTALLEEYIAGGIDKMLDANSRLLKKENDTNSFN